MQDDDSLLMLNLRDGVVTSVGAHAEAGDHPPRALEGQSRYTHHVSLDLSGNNTEVRVWESQNPPGFRIKQYHDQRRAFHVYQPHTRRLTYCVALVEYSPH